MQRIFLTLILFFCALISFSLQASEKPNIIFILADDLARGDVGVYGQQKIETPVLNRLANEGLRFEQAYSGASVCAPSRATLMTGLHTGHCPIRANREIQPEGQMPLPKDTYTVAQQLKSAGYSTLCSGKWGMGRFDSTGSPLKKGFDNFYGYNCQRHAHRYFPDYIYENDQRLELDGKTYAQNWIIDKTLSWIRQHKEHPFFLFYAATLPHGQYEIDDLGLYKDKEGWTEQEKTYAAMVTRLDTQIGQIIALLKELQLDDNTIIFFAGDNGSSFAPHSAISQFFNSNGTLSGQKLRGFKRTHYEGGLRQAFIVRWNNHIKPNTVSNIPVAFWDFLPTAADLSGSQLPNDTITDGISILPLLLEGKKPERDTFYWELHEGTPSLQAARWQDWKFIKNAPSSPLELYDLKSDISETNNLAEQKPDIVKIGEQILQSSRTDSPDWILRDKK